MLNGTEEQNLIERMALGDAVKSLTPKQRATVALRTQGYTQLECSRIFGMTRAAVGFIYKRAKEKLLVSIKELSDV